MKYTLVDNDNPQPGDIVTLEDGRQAKVAKNMILMDIETNKFIGGIAGVPVTTALTSVTAAEAVAKRWEKARDGAEVGMTSAMSSRSGFEAWARLIEQIASDAGNPDVPLRDRVMAMKFLGQATGYLDKVQATQASNPDGGIAMSTDVAMRFLQMLDAKRSDADIIDVTPTDPD